MAAKPEHGMIQHATSDAENIPKFVEGIQIATPEMKLDTSLSRCSLVAIAALLVLAAAGSAWAEVSELRITKQPSIIYLPLVVMEQNKLVEKQASAAGLPELKVAWITFNSGGASTD